MSIATVVTMGYGSFGGIDWLPTIGYSSGIAENNASIDYTDTENRPEYTSRGKRPEFTLYRQRPEYTAQKT